MFSWRYQYDEKPGAYNMLMHRLEIQAPPLWKDTHEKNLVDLALLLERWLR
jgi:hypothetical protein